MKNQKKKNEIFENEDQKGEMNKKIKENKNKEFILDVD